MLPHSTPPDPAVDGDAAAREHTARLDLRTLALVAWSVSMSVSAQLVLKWAMAGLAQESGLALAGRAIQQPGVWAGLALYLSSTLSWLVVLSRIDLAVAYPLGSVSYLLVNVLAVSVLHETVPPLRWVGLALIVLGILVVAHGERRSDGAERGERP